MKKIAFWIAAGGRQDGGKISRNLALAEQLPDEYAIALIVPGNDYTRALDLGESPLVLRTSEDDGWQTSGPLRCLDDHGWEDGPDLLVIDGPWNGLERPAATLRGRWPKTSIAVIGAASVANDPEIDLVVVPDPAWVPDPACGRAIRDRILGGARYTILGRTGTPRDWRPPPNPARVVITAGNLDPFDVTGLFLRALEQCREPVSVTVVVGGGFLNVEQLREQVARSGLDVQLVERLHDPGPLLAETDLALTTYGPFNLELAQIGVPALVATHTKDDVYRAGRLEELGFLRVGGWVNEVAPGEFADQIDELLGSPPTLADMSAAGKQFIDGRGAARVASRLERLLHPD